jgi:hypothetical protein
MDTVVHFLHQERAKLRLAAADKEAAEAAAAAALSLGTGADGTQAAGSGLQLDYQRKVTPSERAVLLADILDDACEAAQGGHGKWRRLACLVAFVPIPFVGCCRMEQWSKRQAWHCVSLSVPALGG